MSSVDPRELIASTVSGIRRRAGAYSQHRFTLAVADMLASTAAVHYPVRPLGVRGPECCHGCGWLPPSQVGWPCVPVLAAVAVCEAWRAADRTEATT